MATASYTLPLAPTVDPAQIGPTVTVPASVLAAACSSLASAEAAASGLNGLTADKWIGLSLAIGGSMLIGTSFIITKKGLMDAADRDEGMSGSDGHAYLTSPLWWAGMVTMVIGEVANFAAYTFAPPILVTPLGALSVLIGAVLAAFILKEELGRIGKVGCMLCLIGTIIIVLHAPEDKEIHTVDEILHYVLQWGFMTYVIFVVAFCTFMILRVVPEHGKRSPIVYISICSLIGSVSVMSVKGFGVAIKLTFAGNNQLTHPSTYVFALTTGLCILMQMHYFNKALDTFSTNVVNPIYYVFFTTMTIIASALLFKGFNTTGGVNTTSLLCGFLVIFVGVYLLNVSRLIDPAAQNIPRASMMSARASTSNWHPNDLRRASETGERLLPGENGFMTPRMSMSGSARASFSRDVSSAAGPRRSSIYRPDHARRDSAAAAANVLFGAFERRGSPATVPEESVGLTQLNEEEDEVDGMDGIRDDDDDDDRLGGGFARRSNQFAPTIGRPPRGKAAGGAGAPRRSTSGGGGGGGLRSEAEYGEREGDWVPGAGAGAGEGGGGGGGGPSRWSSTPTGGSRRNSRDGRLMNGGGAKCPVGGDR